ncbi:hypothetical protein VKT23_010835 [Stygiomarasmius scandens]|uniref:CxC2-like cysteine cluster KDZ transposase-associated domain-containing protein n=1 Tax=Marasmiellus scandens TaxID=2682957 RepID=A0ABR1JFZ4_9AGAR
MNTKITSLPRKRRPKGVTSTVLELSDDEESRPSTTPTSKQNTTTTITMLHTSASSSQRLAKRRLIHHDLASDETPSMFRIPNSLQKKLNLNMHSESLPMGFLCVGDAYDAEMPMGLDYEGEELRRDYEDDSDSDGTDSEEDDAEGVTVQVTKGKKPRKARGDSALSYWLNFVDIYLSELIRHDGRGYAINQTSCHGCNNELPSSSYQCLDCEDSRLWCGECIVDRHAYLPFHKVQKWNGQHFELVTLNDLVAPIVSLTVLDITGVHTLNVKACQCDKEQGFYRQLLRAQLYPASHKMPRTVASFRLLQHFQLLSFVSKVSIREYCTALERFSNNISVLGIKDRYRELLRMAREWRLLKVLKRHGRGHDPTGYRGTGEGECAVLCAACLIPGVNLPDDWRETPPEKSWLYRLFLSMDANFRCCRLRVSSEAADPGLGDGFQYFAPVKKFQDFLSKYGTEVNQDINTCHNHSTLRLASMRRDPGLASTGIAITECSRHDTKHPAAVVDLQVGERYVNMDFTLIAVLLRFMPDSALVSYDVMCQYLKNLYYRFESVYGPDWCPTLSVERFEGAIPKFHLPAHIEKCGTTFNLNYIPQAGRTNGEGVERGFSITNGLAGSTKVMGPGSRRDTLDDHFGFINWRKRTLYPVQFLIWAKKASKKRETAVKAFWDFNQGMQDSQRKEWRKAVEEWEADNDKSNPYESTVKPLTFHKVRRDLAQAEANNLERRNTSASLSSSEETSITALIVEGVDLREQQRRLRYDTKQLGPHCTDRAQHKILERANTLRRRLEAWCAAQSIHFPKAPSIRTALARKTDSNATVDIILLLPSELVEHGPCSIEALDMQWQLEFALANDMLEQIRQALLQRTYLYAWKNRYTHGQKDSTRSSATIGKVQDKIDASATRYRIARKALSTLAKHLKKGSEWEQCLRPLKDEDIVPLSQDNFDADKTDKVGMSWIWLAGGLNQNGEARMADALRIAWLKARARAHRYQEECVLLQEEMRRILATLRFEADKWRKLQDQGSVEGLDSTLEAIEGRRSYAGYQVFVRTQMEKECRETWKEIPPRFLDGIGAIRLEDSVYNFV